jgi:hypothetical protein
MFVGIVLFESRRQSMSLLRCCALPIAIRSIVTYLLFLIDWFSSYPSHISAQLSVYIVALFILVLLISHEKQLTPKTLVAQQDRSEHVASHP